MIEAKQKEIASLTNLLNAYTATNSTDVDEIHDNLLTSQRDLIILELERLGTETEAKVFSAALGDDIGGNQPHTLKSTYAHMYPK